MLWIYCDPTDNDVVTLRIETVFMREFQLGCGTWSEVVNYSVGRYAPDTDSVYLLALTSALLSSSCI